MFIPKGLDPLAAPSAHLYALAAHMEALRHERMPTDPPLDPEVVVDTLQRSDPAAERHHIVIWWHDRIVAHASIRFPLPPGSVHADAQVTVLPEFRQRGLMRALLLSVVHLAQQANRSLLRGFTSSRVPAGEAALLHLNARPVMRQQFMELTLREFDRQAVVSWIHQRAATSPDYRVWSHLGSYPEQRLPDIAAVYNLMNTAPQGTQSISFASMTPEKLRQDEQQFLAHGRQRLTTFAEHVPGGSLVAFTELFWETARPGIVIQHGTAVSPEHRQRALGRWIKSANLLALLERNPGAASVRAGNTLDNVGMLNINRALGFSTYLIHTDWEANVPDILAYLQKHEPAG